MNKFFIKNNSLGFTLVETLVAVAIFSASVVAMMSVLGQNISNVNYVKSRMTATYLAQEGIEYARNVRDTYVIYDSTSTQNGWNNFNAKFSAASCAASSGCYFDLSNLVYTNPSQPIISTTLTACNGSSGCPVLLYNSATGVYGYASGLASPFVRKISTTQVSANETKITSTVSWTQGASLQSVVFSESVFNWIE